MDTDLGEKRLNLLEADVDKCITAMSELQKHAKAIPRIVAALSAMHNKPLTPMGEHAMAAVKSGKNKGGAAAAMGSGNGNGNGNGNGANGHKAAPAAVDAVEELPADPAP